MSSIDLFQLVPVRSSRRSALQTRQEIYSVLTVKSTLVSLVPERSSRRSALAGQTRRRASCVRFNEGVLPTYVRQNHLKRRRRGQLRPLEVIDLFPAVVFQYLNFEVHELDKDSDNCCPTLCSTWHRASLFTRYVITPAFVFVVIAPAAYCL